MKSNETLFNEAMGKMSDAQKSQFFAEKLKIETSLGQKLLSVETQLNIAKGILGGKVNAVESFHESHRIRRNNGRDLFQESATTEMTEFQERQIKAYMAMGHTLLEAETFAGVHDKALKVAAFQGKTAGQFFESLKESRGEGHAADLGDLKKRQEAAYRRMSGR